MRFVHNYFKLFMIVIISILILISFRQICGISHTRGVEVSDKYGKRVIWDVIDNHVVEEGVEH